MKKKLLVLSLVLVLGAGAGITAKATSDVKPNPNTTHSCNSSLGMKAATGIKGHDVFKNLLKDKYKVSEDDLNKALTSGKTFKDIAKEKGISEETLISDVKNEKIKLIDAAIAEGKITKENGEKIKENIKNNSQSCVGNPNKRNGNKNGKGMGKMNKNCIGSEGNVNSNANTQ